MPHARAHRFPRAGWLLLAAGGAAVLAGVRLTQTKRGAHAPPRPPVREVTLDDAGSYWTREGFVLMEAPVRPPTSEDGREHIVVYLKLPSEGVVETQPSGSGAPPRLRFPAGTRADRVEYAAMGALDDAPQPTWRVLDVRGTVLGGAADELHAYRPAASSAGASLVGLAWPRGDDFARREATEALGFLVEDGRVRAPSAAGARERLAGELRSLNDCAGCHVPDRPGRARIDSPGFVNRGADASGFFHVPTVLSDRAPVETHRPRNANAGDRFLRFVCGPGEEPAVVGGGFGRVKCPGGEIPWGVLDVPAAIRAGDAHALRVCASRTFLYGRLDEAGKKLYADAARECEAD